jgi:hypothetical protein
MNDVRTPCSFATTYRARRQTGGQTDVILAADIVYVGPTYTYTVGPRSYSKRTIIDNEENAVNGSTSACKKQKPVLTRNAIANRGGVDVVLPNSLIVSKVINSLEPKL